MASCSDGCKEEFKKSNFGLDHESPHLFVTSQWAKWDFACFPIVYVLYRLVVFAGLGTILALRIYTYHIDDYGWALYFGYLSNWAFILLTLDALVQLIFSLAGYIRFRKSDGDSWCSHWDKTYSYMPWYLKLTWVLSNVAICTSLLIFIVFWALLFPPDFEIDHHIWNSHLTNILYIVINVFLTAMPVRIYHVFHSWILGIIYILSAVVYQLIFDQPVAYPILNFVENPGTATAYALLLAFGLTTAIWLVYYALYRIRLGIYNCASEKQDTAGADGRIVAIKSGSDSKSKSNGNSVNPEDITAEKGWTIATSPRSIDTQPVTTNRNSYPGFQGFDNRGFQGPFVAAPVQNGMVYSGVGLNGMGHTGVGFNGVGYNPIGYNSMVHNGMPVGQHVSQTYTY